VKLSLPIIAITMGDPAGIGPEIILKALSSPEVAGLCEPVVLGDENVFKDLIDKPSFNLQSLTCLDPQKIKPGKPDLICGEAVVVYIREAVKMALAGDVDAVVTAPVNKDVVNWTGLDFSGHTEFIADITETDEFCMMLASDKIRVSLVTIHSPLRAVPGLLSKEKVLKTIMVTHKAMINLFGISSPRIGVASLNPHGGEKGLFGDEEETVILPAVKEAVRSGADVEGPFPSDSLFHEVRRNSYDAYIAMYHDQGLIPVKLLSFREAVNVTLGLPIIRTSVDHGTAYNIAGKDMADPASLINAIKMAVEMAERKVAGCQ